MATEKYFNSNTPRYSWGGFYSSLSPDNRRTYSASLRRFRQHYLHDKSSLPYKAFSSSLASPIQSPSTPITTTTTTTTTTNATNEPLSDENPQQVESMNRSSSFSSMSSQQYQSSIDLMASSLKCDDCQTNDGLFQCCHCNQRLCIRCCNKHYKNVTIELERLHELSDRLVAKIVHTKNDLERQKNEALEQCHKWRIDTINTINKAHGLIIQTINDEYETLGKEYELFVQNGMQHIHLDQHELMRMKKGNLGAVISSSSSSATTTSTSINSIDTIRKRIELFAKTIDETGKFLFQVKLPTFDIDDNLRVESRFGDATRSTSATWQASSDIPSPVHTDLPIQDDELLMTDVLLPGNDASSSNIKNDIIDKTTDEIEKLSDRGDEQELDIDTSTTNSSSLSSSPAPAPTPVPAPSLRFEVNNSNSVLLPPSRYALSVENDIELQQQQFYSPTFRGNRYDSAYGTAPSSPSSSLSSHYFSTSSLNEKPAKVFSTANKSELGSFYDSRRHTHTFQRTSSPQPKSASNSYDENHQNRYYRTNENEDSYRSLQHIELKHEQDGSLEGVAIQIEQSHKTEGAMERRRTCMQACGVRRRTTVLPPRASTTSSSSAESRFSHNQPWLYYRTNSTPSFTP